LGFEIPSELEDVHMVNLSGNQLYGLSCVIF